MFKSVSSRSNLFFVVVLLSLAGCAGGSSGERVYDSGQSTTTPSSPSTPVATPTPAPTPVPAPTPTPIPTPNLITVNVSNESELQFAVRNAVSDSVIEIAAGTYTLTNTLHLTHGVQNVVIRGATGNRDDVVLIGRGMSQSSFGNVPHGIMISDAQDILIEALTVRDVYYHPITLQAAAGCQRVTMRNLRLVNAGEQFIKSNSSQTGGVHDSVVEDCIMEYDTTARGTYTNGVDVHQGQNWIIRRCVFRNIVAPANQGLAGPAVLMWNHSADTVVENNIFVNCARGIAFGLDINRVDEHSGGIIRNNVIFRSSAQPGDVGIGLTNAPGALVLHNTVVLSGTYTNAIEYRTINTTGVVIQNNFCDARILERDGASATLTDNRTDAAYADFMDPLNGDFHLAPGSIALDQGVVHGMAQFDMDGDNRQPGSSVDLGADER